MYNNRITYEGNKWYICDGDGVKGSTNGTWLFADDFIEISENMLFKAALTLFQANFIDNTK